MRKLNKKGIALIVVFVLAILSLVGFYSWQAFKKGQEASGTGQIRQTPYFTTDQNIQKLSAYNLDEGLKQAEDRFEKNDEKDLGDYSQLMWIYIDKGRYSKVIDLGEDALEFIDKEKIDDLKAKRAIVSQMIQAYIYDGDVTNAEATLEKNKDMVFLYEKYLIEYKKGNYQFLAENHENMKKDGSAYVGLDVGLLAKAYEKLGDTSNAIKSYEEMYAYGNQVEKEDLYLSTVYLYISSSHLKDLYTKSGDSTKATMYDTTLQNCKSRIDNEQTIGEVTFNKKDSYFAINRFDEF